MIYFDNAATTKPDINALIKAEKFNTDQFFNPSTLYQGGLSCAKEIKIAKENILKQIGAIGFDLIFTSCGTESDNMAILGAVKRGTFVTDLGEHSAVYKSFLELKNRGQNVKFISLNKDGSVCVEELIDFVKNNSVDFVSIMHVNNETGAINNVNDIAKKIKAISPKIVFHVDGVQAFGKIRYNISKDIDLYSISAHKINGLKGVGALIKKKTLNVAPLVIGGGQEGGLRSGTENVFGIKVFEYASQTHYENIKTNFNKVLEIREFIKANLSEDFKIISSDNSSPYILTISAVGLRGEVVMHSLETRGVIVGNGSACSSKNRFSRVIEACGYANDVLDGVIRLSFSVENTPNEAKVVVDILNSTISELKRTLQWIIKQL